MVSAIKRLYDGLVLMEELQDPRTHGDPFLASPLCLAAVVAFYIYFFKSLGPRLMKNRKPFNVKTAMILYNILQMVLNGHLATIGTKALFQMKNAFCEEVDYSYSPKGQLYLQIGRMYTYLKLFDVIDTLFFLLRKSYRQISFLHIYHHSAMMVLVWITMRYYAGGSSGWVATLNAYVHCAMFAYYLLTAIDSRWKQSLILKRSLTQIQMVQFAVFIIVYGKIVLWPTCQFPKLLALLLGGQSFLIMILFCDFYIKTYIKKDKKV